MSKKLSDKGFGAVEVLVAVVVITVLGFGGWAVWHNHQSKKVDNNTKSQTSTTPKAKSQTVDPYAGWKTETSTRAGFTIKHPISWIYTENLGKDNLEHISIANSGFILNITTYSGTDPTQGGVPSSRTCSDCIQATSLETFAAPGIGSLSLDSTTYTLDSSHGNALILEQKDGSYYLPSPINEGTYTTFRGISVLESESAYQSEAPSSFMANTDLKTAEQILKSLSY